MKNILLLHADQLRHDAPRLQRRNSGEHAPA